MNFIILGNVRLTKIETSPFGVRIGHHKFKFTKI